MAFFGSAGSRAGSTINFAEIAEKEERDLTGPGVSCTQKAFRHELSDQALPIKPTGPIVKVRPRYLVIPRRPSSPIRSSSLFHITNRASNGCDVKHLNIALENHQPCLLMDHFCPLACSTRNKKHAPGNNMRPRSC